MSRTQAPSRSAGGAAGDRLVVGQNYIGSNGAVALDTVLGGDASITDKLVVNGNTAGTSSVAVINAGGRGAATSDGIEMITMGGASNGVFSLAGDYEINGKGAVVAGAYAYQLYKGNKSATELNNWYLRSELPNPATPGDTPPGPLYQAGVPTYEAYPQALLALNGVSTLQQRVGNRSWSGAGSPGMAASAGTAKTAAATPAEGGAFIEGNGAWGRISTGLQQHCSPRASTSIPFSINIFRRCR